MKSCHKPDVHGNIAAGGHGQKQEGRPGISQCGEDPVGDIVEEYKRKTPDVNPQIEGGIGEQDLRRLDHGQETSAEEEADQHQDGTDHAARDHGGGDGRLHFLKSFGAKKHRDENGAADIAAKGERDEDECNFIAVADCREGILADEFAGDETVRNIIKLLKENASEKRQAELPENGLWFPASQIFVQNIVLLCCAFNERHYYRTILANA